MKRKRGEGNQFWPAVRSSLVFVVTLIGIYMGGQLVGAFFGSFVLEDEVQVVTTHSRVLGGYNVFLEVGVTLAPTQDNEHCMARVVVRIFDDTRLVYRRASPLHWVDASGTHYVFQMHEYFDGTGRAEYAVDWSCSPNLHGVDLDAWWSVTEDVLQELLEHPSFQQYSRDLIVLDEPR